MSWLVLFYIFSDDVLEHLTFRDLSKMISRATRSKIPNVECRLLIDTPGSGTILLDFCCDLANGVRVRRVREREMMDPETLAWFLAAAGGGRESERTALFFCGHGAAYYLRGRDPDVRLYLDDLGKVLSRSPIPFIDLLVFDCCLMASDALVLLPADKIGLVLASEGYGQNSGFISKRTLAIFASSLPPKKIAVQLVRELIMQNELEGEDADASVIDLSLLPEFLATLPVVASPIGPWIDPSWPVLVDSGPVPTPVIYSLRTTNHPQPDHGGLSITVSEEDGDHNLPAW